MRARRVKGIDPDGTFAAGIGRTVEVRARELVALLPAAREPGAVDALHDVRIAAKRLRYVLEVARPCFGAPAREGAKRARRLQDLLGAIHDCDELLPLVAGHPPAARLLRARRERLFARFLDRWGNMDEDAWTLR